MPIHMYIKMLCLKWNSFVSVGSMTQNLFLKNASQLPWSHGNWPHQLNFCLIKVSKYMKKWFQKANFCCIRSIITLFIMNLLASKHFFLWIGYFCHFSNFNLVFQDKTLRTCTYNFSGLIYGPFFVVPYV